MSELQATVHRSLALSIFIIGTLLVLLARSLAQPYADILLFFTPAYLALSTWMLPHFYRYIQIGHARRQLREMEKIIGDLNFPESQGELSGLAKELRGYLIDLQLAEFPDVRQRIDDTQETDPLVIQRKMRATAAKMLDALKSGDKRAATEALADAEKEQAVEQALSKTDHP